MLIVFVLKRVKIILVVLVLLSTKGGQNAHVAVIVFNRVFRVLLIHVIKVFGVTLIALIQLLTLPRKSFLVICVVLNALVKKVLALFEPSFGASLHLVVTVNADDGQVLHKFFVLLLFLTKFICTSEFASFDLSPEASSFIDESKVACS